MIGFQQACGQAGWLYSYFTDTGLDNKCKCSFTPATGDSFVMSDGLDSFCELSTTWVSAFRLRLDRPAPPLSLFSPHTLYASTVERVMEVDSLSPVLGLCHDLRARFPAGGILRDL